MLLLYFFSKKKLANFLFAWSNLISTIVKLNCYSILHDHLLFPCTSQVEDSSKVTIILLVLNWHLGFKTDNGFDSSLNLLDVSPLSNLTMNCRNLPAFVHLKLIIQCKMTLGCPLKNGPDSMQKLLTWPGIGSFAVNNVHLQDNYVV